MARFSSGVLTGAGSATLGQMSLMAIASIGGQMREVQVYNTTSVAANEKLARITVAGGTHAALAEAKHNPDSAGASCTAVSTDTGTAPTYTDTVWQGQLGAAIGSGIIATFGDTGVRIPPGTANGLGLIVESGTPQAIQATMVWDE